MGLFSGLTTFLGLILLSHAGYSAHEHTALHSNARFANAAAVPRDIVIEALIALVIVSAGLVLSADRLKPISWSVWAGEIEKEGGERNPYKRLEDRQGFMDIRARRKEFADWVRNQDDTRSAKQG